LMKKKKKTQMTYANMQMTQACVSETTSCHVSACFLAMPVSNFPMITRRQAEGVGFFLR
jgi:hypothetical protein